MSKKFIDNTKGIHRNPRAGHDRRIVDEGFPEAQGEITVAVRVVTFSEKTADRSAVSTRQT